MRRQPFTVLPPNVPVPPPPASSRKDGDPKAPEAPAHSGQQQQQQQQQQQVSDHAAVTKPQSQQSRRTAATTSSSSQHPRQQQQQRHSLSSNQSQSHNHGHGHGHSHSHSAYSAEMMKAIVEEFGVAFPIVYLDIQDIQSPRYAKYAKSLKEKLMNIGIRIEQFFSPQIVTHLIVQTLPPSLQNSAAPAPAALSTTSSSSTHTTTAQQGASAAASDLPAAPSAATAAGSFKMLTLASTSAPAVPASTSAPPSTQSASTADSVMLTMYRKPSNLIATSLTDVPVNTDISAATSSAASKKFLKVISKEASAQSLASTLNAHEPASGVSAAAAEEKSPMSLIAKAQMWGIGIKDFASIFGFIQKYTQLLQRLLMSSSSASEQSSSSSFLHSKSNGAPVREQPPASSIHGAVPFGHLEIVPFSKPFVKIEDLSGKFLPVYREFNQPVKSPIHDFVRQNVKTPLRRSRPVLQQPPPLPAGKGTSYSVVPYPAPLPSMSGSISNRESMGHYVFDPNSNSSLSKASRLTSGSVSSIHSPAPAAAPAAASPGTCLASPSTAAAAFSPSRSVIFGSGRMSRSKPMLFQPDTLNPAAAASGPTAMSPTTHASLQRRGSQSPTAKSGNNEFAMPATPKTSSTSGGAATATLPTAFTFTPPTGGPSGKIQPSSRQQQQENRRHTSAGINVNGSSKPSPQTMALRQPTQTSTNGSGSGNSSASAVHGSAATPVQPASSNAFSSAVASKSATYAAKQVVSASQTVALCRENGVAAGHAAAASTETSLSKKGVKSSAEKSGSTVVAAKKQGHAPTLCECCGTYFTCTAAEHERSSKHAEFVQDTKNYGQLDSFLKKYELSNADKFLATLSDFYVAADASQRALPASAPSDASMLQGEYAQGALQGSSTMLESSGLSAADAARIQVKFSHSCIVMDASTASGVPQSEPNASGCVDGSSHAVNQSTSKDDEESAASPMDCTGGHVPLTRSAALRNGNGHASGQANGRRVAAAAVSDSDSDGVDEAVLYSDLLHPRSNAAPALAAKEPCDSETDYEQVCGGDNDDEDEQEEQGEQDEQEEQEEVDCNGCATRQDAQRTRTARRTRALRRRTGGKSAASSPQGHIAATTPLTSPQRRQSPRRLGKEAAGDG